MYNLNFVLLLIVSYNRNFSNYFFEGIEPSKKIAIHLTAYRGGSFLLQREQRPISEETESSYTLSTGLDFRSPYGILF